MDILKQNRLTNLQKLIKTISMNTNITNEELIIIFEQILFINKPDYLFKNQIQINKAVKELNEYKDIINNDIKFEVEDNEICPVTRMPIINSIIGKCGHKFERNSFEDLKKRKLKCPVIGCGRGI